MRFVRRHSWRESLKGLLALGHPSFSQFGGLLVDDLEKGGLARYQACFLLGGGIVLSPNCGPGLLNLTELSGQTVLFHRKQLQVIHWRRYLSLAFVFGSLEYLGNRFIHHLCRQDTTSQPAVHDSPQSNGIAERRDGVRVRIHITYFSASFQGNAVSE